MRARVSQWPGQPSRAEGCGAGKASGTSRTNPRRGKPTMRKGSYSEELIKINLHIENFVNTELHVLRFTVSELERHDWQVLGFAIL